MGKQLPHIEKGGGQVLLSLEKDYLYSMQKKFIKDKGE